MPELSFEQVQWLGTGVFELTRKFRDCFSRSTLYYHGTIATMTKVLRAPLPHLVIGSVRSALTSEMSQEVIGNVHHFYKGQFPCAQRHRACGGSMRRESSSCTVGRFAFHLLHMSLNCRQITSGAGVIEFPERDDGRPTLGWFISYSYFFTGNPASFWS